MDEPEIVRRNIDHLLAYAADHKESLWPPNKKALTRRIAENAGEAGPEAQRRARSTVQRTIKGDTTPRVDTVGLIAQAFGLQAWQLLIPDIDPTNPPVVSVTAEERELWKRMHEVTAIIRSHHAARRTTRASDGSGPHRQSQEPKKRTGTQPKPAGRRPKEKETSQKRS